MHQLIFLVTQQLYACHKSISEFSTHKFQKTASNSDFHKSLLVEMVFRTAILSSILYHYFKGNNVRIKEKYVYRFLFGSTQLRM